MSDDEDYEGINCPRCGNVGGAWHYSGACEEPLKYVEMFYICSSVVWYNTVYLGEDGSYLVIRAWETDSGYLCCAYADMYKFDTAKEAYEFLHEEIGKEGKDYSEMPEEHRNDWEHMAKYGPIRLYQKRLYDQFWYEMFKHCIEMPITNQLVNLVHGYVKLTES